jgi:aspartate/methionine/tyrosine aminotransferase
MKSDRLYYSAHIGRARTFDLRKATRDDAVAVVHSFSKSYCMTGWRVGRSSRAATWPQSHRN